MFDAILCHCGNDQAGHVPGADGCAEAPVRAGRNGDDWCSRDHSYHCPTCHPAPHGGCPVCRKRIKVVRIETRGAPPAHRWARDPRAPKRGPLLQVQPGIGPHRHAGQDCPGAGQVPAETRYTPGRELASWISVNGDESVA